MQQLDETSPGFVVGAISRVGTLNGGVTPTDSDDILMRMAFIRFATSGSGPLTFSDANIDFIATPGLPPVATIPPIEYIGGTILMVPSLPEE